MMSKDIEKMERESGRGTDEPWIDWHHRMYDAMVAHQRESSSPTSPGKWIDPVSKREFPKGQQMVRDPNRKQRRDLEAFRRAGKMPSKRR